MKTILGNNVAFMDDCLAKGVITLDALQAFAKKQAPDIKLIINWAASTQVKHWMGVLDGWRASLGPDWDKTYAAANTIYVARQNNVLFSTLAQYFPPEAINDRLMLIETISFTTTPQEMLTSMVRIISDRSVGALFFGNDRLMDFELMGGDARKTIISEMQRRGKQPFLPPAVPFGSHQWPTLITPGPRRHLARRPEVRREWHSHESCNTIVRGEAAQVVRGDRMARRPCLSGRRHLAVLRAAGRHRHAGRSRRGSAGRRSTVTPAGLEIAATCKIVELHDFKGPPEWRAVPLFDKCIDCVPDVVQDLERGDRRRQRLHVAAGRRHDLADRGARRRLHAVAAQRQAAPGSGRRLRHRQPHERPAEGRAAALDPPARLGACPSASPCARCRSPISAARRR